MSATSANLLDKWPMIAAAGIGVGITLWTLKPESGKEEKEMKTNITRSIGRVCNAINVYDKASSTKRNQVLEKNEKIRSKIAKAEVVGETIANYEILKKSVDNLTETIKFVQRVKAQQENTPGREPIEDFPEIGQWREDPELKIALESETESEDVEEESNTLGQLENVATIVGAGIQRMSGFAQGLFFGSQRRLSTTSRQSTS